MNKTEVLKVRVTPDQLNKLNYMADATDAKRGWVVRQLIDRAELITPALFAPGVSTGNGPSEKEARHVHT